jgi:hypothetical protein
MNIDKGSRICNVIREKYHECFNKRKDVLIAVILF